MSLRIQTKVDPSSVRVGDWEVAAENERILRDTRAFRVYDWSSEVHRWALGARIVDGKM